MVQSIHYFVMQRILETAIPKVASNGWKSALTLAIRESGASDQAVSIFPNGSLCLVEHWLEKNVEQLKSAQLTSQSEFGRLKELFAFRLAANTRISPFLGEAQDMLARNPKIGAHHLSQLSDELWWLAGDRSTDSVWYTRRGSVAALYAAAETVQRYDTSRNQRDTQRFVNAQIDRLETLEYAGSSVLEWAQFNAIATFNVAKSLTR